jgi:hypothetical protein
MSRSLQIGDYAFVYGNVYTVEEIRPEGIYMAPLNGTWEFYPYHKLENVIFKASPNLIDLPEIDQQILLNLDYQSLMNACQVFPKICLDDYFWQQKVISDFGTEVSALKPSNTIASIAWIWNQLLSIII